MKRLLKNILAICTPDQRQTFDQLTAKGYQFQCLFHDGSLEMVNSLESTTAVLYIESDGTTKNR